VRIATFRGAHATRQSLDLVVDPVGGSPTSTRESRVLPSKRTSRDGCFVQQKWMAMLCFPVDPPIPEADDPTSMNHRNQAGITWVEVLVCVVIVLVLWSLSIPAVTAGPSKSTLTASLSNMKQLHLVTQQMAVDGVTAGNTNLGWPGDTGGSFSNWSAQILKGGYLTTNDLCKMLSAAGCIVPQGKIPQMNQTAVRLYAVTDASPTNAVLLTSANFTNTPAGGEPLNPSAKPFGNKGFVVFRKGGDGAVLRPNQTGQTNLIGSFVPMCR